jgi:hypothetical protein
VDAWNTPIGVTSGIRALGYDLLQGLGFLPSPIPGRYLAPMLLLAFAGLVRAVTSPLDGLRRVGSLAIWCTGCGIIAQTLYAARVGTMVPLQPHYLSPWFPLLMIAVIAGGSEMGSATARVTIVGSLVGLSIATVAVTPVVDWIEESELPRRYEELCGALSTYAAADDAVVFSSDLHAKLVNINCPIETWQAIGEEGMQKLPKEVRTATFVDACRGSAMTPASGWAALSEPGACLGNVSLTRLRRQSMALGEMIRGQ